MTIYTDPVTGKQYDRVYEGMTADRRNTWPADYKSCSECAFSDPVKYGEECARGTKRCVVTPRHGKVVFFVFKERGA